MITTTAAAASVETMSSASVPLATETEANHYRTNSQATTDHPPNSKRLPRDTSPYPLPRDRGPAGISAASGGTPRRPPPSLSLYKRTHPSLELGGEARLQQAGSSSKFPSQSTSETGQIQSNDRNQTRRLSPMSPSELGTHIQIKILTCPRVNEAALSSLPPVIPRWFC
jgi:hypothetical protein